ncbi:helix-turn-helix domain-containing protein [bacterium]|nr:helix-turn-helix domain-containing protein [bacterium]
MKRKRRLSKTRAADSAQLPYVEFGKLIRNLRLKMGMSQVSLGEELGLHPSYVSRMEHGERRASPEVLKRMSELLDCPLDHLLVVTGLTEDSLSGNQVTVEKVVSLRKEVEQLRRRVGEIAQAEAGRKPPRGRQTKLRAVPVFDAAPAGILLPAVRRKKKALKTVKLPESELKYHPDAFALVASDDSMIDAGILEGDVVVVSPKAKVKSGDTALVARRGKKASVKTVYLEGDKVVLHSANRKYHPAVLNYPKDVEIIGKAVLVWRKLG